MPSLLNRSNISNFFFKLGMMKCAEALKPYSHWTGAARQRGHRAERVVSTTEEAMITLVHQVRRKNLDSISYIPGTPSEKRGLEVQAIHGYYLYIIAWEYTTVSNSGLCT